MKLAPKLPHLMRTCYQGFEMVVWWVIKLCRKVELGKRGLVQNGV